MKKAHLLFVLIGLSILFAACTKKTFKLKEEFTLAFNHTGIVKLGGKDKMELKFTKLVEESRCAPGKTCVWEGRVSVDIELDNNEIITLGLGDGFTSVTSYKNHNIELLEVSYDSKENFGKETNYSIKLKVD
jgi:hypothetical protein